VNDDYFITIISTTSALISSITNILIGYLLDRIIFKWFFTLFCFSSGILFIILPLVAASGKAGFGIS